MALFVKLLFLFCNSDECFLYLGHDSVIKLSFLFCDIDGCFLYLGHDSVDRVTFSVLIEKTISGSVSGEESRKK